MSNEVLSRQELLELVRNCCPDLGWDNKYPNLFGKYGITIAGICLGWYWFEEDNITGTARDNGKHPITDATREELLEMLALAYHSSLNSYREWYHESKTKSDKLDGFIGKCERDYFGYDEDGYTDKTINRIFKSIYQVLDKKNER